MISQIFVSLFILITFYQKNQVFSSPVLLWSNVNLPEPAVPLSKLPSNTLISDYICKLTNKQIQLHLLAVNDLTIEQIQRGSQRNHPILLDAKQDKTNFRYYPNVANDALKTFQLIRQSNNMKCSDKQFEISTSSLDGTLYDALNTMQTTIDNTATDEKKAVVIALVSNPSNSQTLSRRRRATNETTKRVLISKDQKCMFYAEQLRWHEVNGTQSVPRNYSLNYDASSCKQNDGNGTSVTLDLVWTNDNTSSDTVKISLITKIIGRYWHLTNASLNSVEYRHFANGMYDQMTTPPGYSYVCSSATFVRFNSSILHGKYNFTDKFVLLNLQFQPMNVSNLTFGPPNYCTSFFTSGIWMGITSSLLCLAILLFGIYQMMTIKSNDRFDDPKGKPLVIKAQE